MRRSCTKCFLQKPLEEFGWKNYLFGKRFAVCKEYTAKRSNEWYQDNKDPQKENVRRNNQYYREMAGEYVYRYLLEHPCSNCGEADPRVLEFNSIMKATKKLK